MLDSLRRLPLLSGEQTADAARLAAKHPDAAALAGELRRRGWLTEFMAPEQARNAGTRADVYSLGCTLYFLLTGQVPFPGGNAFDKVIRQQSEEPTPPGLMRWRAVGGRGGVAQDGGRGGCVCRTRRINNNGAGTGPPPPTAHLPQIEPQLTLTGHTAPIYALTFSPDGKSLISGESRQLPQVWPLPSGQKVGQLDFLPGGVRTVGVSPDESM